jgi:thiol-disulfide isomerase/thioredoxin
MKQLFATLSLLFLLSVNTTAQVQYEVSKDPQNGLKTLKGILSIDLLKNDSAFVWMRNDISWYKPNATAVTNLKAVKDTVQLLVFVGTWCEDSHIVFPQLLRLCNEAGFDTKRITVIGVDRNKTTLGSLCEALGVTKAPTILVLKGGKEMGRVEEFGTSGMYDKDLGEVLLKAK